MQMQPQSQVQGKSALVLPAAHREYVDGVTLSAWQARGGHTFREILEMYLYAGAGLDAAHAAGVVHRDFKPDNALCGKDGRLRVVDFGLARIDWISDPATSPEANKKVPAAQHMQGRLTQAGAIAGTPGYMSPEQYLGGNVDSRSDQWSFCAALFESLYGYLPFSGETIAEISKSMQGPPLPPPRDSNVPEEVHRALLRGLAAEPDQRFSSMTELLQALSLERIDPASELPLAPRRLLRWLVVCRP